MGHRAAWLAWSVCGLTVVLIACAVALAFLNKSADVRAVIFPLCLTLSAVVGGLVASRRPANPVGWFFLGSGGGFAITLVATQYSTHGLAGAPAQPGPPAPLGGCFSGGGGGGSPTPLAAPQSPPGGLGGAQAMAWLQSWL